jgi:DNA helicase-2/ATP-dependent DNA helicase PcrA
MDEKIPVKHIVIDEAQDFSTFQLYVIKRIIKDSSFTILGDLCQGIHSYRGIRRWEEVIEQVFEDRDCGYLTLEQSYRTTVEIMDAANKVIARLKDLGVNKGVPVIRHGEPVMVTKKDSVASIAQDIIEKVSYLKSINYKTIAIICKTMEECEAFSPLLKKDIKDIYIITGNEKEYRSGVVLVPSYLSKGLEFDAVFIADANNANYKDNELDTKLL